MATAKTTAKKKAEDTAKKTTTKKVEEIKEEVVEEVVENIAEEPKTNDAEVIEKMSEKIANFDAPAEEEEEEIEEEPFEEATVPNQYIRATAKVPLRRNPDLSKNSISGYMSLVSYYKIDEVVENLLDKFYKLDMGMYVSYSESVGKTEIIIK